MAKERITRRLKVYTTRIGIHDWAVAVPSQKEALKAWDVRENLFASGAAKVVDDPDVVAAAMKMPGQPVAIPGSKMPDRPEKKSNVVRLDERRAAKAAGGAKKPATATHHEAKKIVERRRAARPPDRSRLDSAEAELREFDIEVKVRRKELARRKQELDRELESFETDSETRRGRLERQLEKARAQFDKLSS